MARILVVEDDAAQQLLVDTILRRAGHQVVCVNNGMEALALLGEGTTFDVVLCDLRLPKLDGLRFLQTMRSDYPNVPTIMMSVQSGANWMAEATAQGAAQCVVKPFVGTDLLEAVEAALAGIRG